MSIPYPTGPFVRPWRIIGDHLGTNGTGFSLSQFDQGRIVKRIGVHYNPRTCLRGIAISYENGDRDFTGTAQNNYAEITLQPGETITRASLWGNGVGTRTGRIWFETDRGRTFNAGRDTTGQDEFPINVGSGILAGFVGRSGTDIYILGFAFIIPVRSTTISNVRFGLPSGDSIVPHVLVHETPFTNNQTDRDLDWDFSNEVERTNSVTFSSSVTLEFGASLSVSAGIPAIVSVEGGYSWGISGTTTWQRTTETTVRFRWSLNGTLGPGEQVICTAICQFGRANVKYTADVSHVFTDGQVWSYSDRGTLENAEYAFAEASARTGRIGDRVHEVQESKEADAVVAVGNSAIKPRL